MSYRNRKEEAQLRQEPADEIELAILAKARRTTDPRKLAQMIPTYLKNALAKSLPSPKIYRPGMRLPLMVTHIGPEVRKFPGEWMAVGMKTQEYVQAYYELNKLQFVEGGKDHG